MELQRLLERRSDLSILKFWVRRTHFCFFPSISFLSVFVLASMLAVKEVKFPLIVFYPDQSGEVEEKNTRA